MDVQQKNFLKNDRFSRIQYSGIKNSISKKLILKSKNDLRLVLSNYFQN